MSWKRFVMAGKQDSENEIKNQNTFGIVSDC